MIDFDSEKFMILVWDHASQQGTISPETWEQIIAVSCDGRWIGGDKYMADAVKKTNGLNAKSIKKVFAKGDNQTLSFIQCRIPIDNEDSLTDEQKGKEVIKTLVRKRDDSVEKFDLTKMYDVLVVHYREGDDYYVRLFCDEQMKYEELDLVWNKGAAKLRGSGKNDSWLMSRNGGNASAYQTCLHIKKVYNKMNAIFDLKIKAPFTSFVDFEQSKQRYDRYHSTASAS